MQMTVLNAFIHRLGIHPKANYLVTTLMYSLTTVKLQGKKNRYKS